MHDRLSFQVEEMEFTAKDMEKMAGVSYRMLNDWDSKGLLPAKPRHHGTEWRKFGNREAFILLVLLELRKDYNFPLEELRWVRDFMFQDGPNHFKAAVEFMRWGTPVLLFTNLTDAFEMNNAREIGWLLRHGYFVGTKGKGYVMIKINHLVNTILARQKKPIVLTDSLGLYKIISEAEKAITAQTSAEFDVLRLMRDDDVSAIEIKKKNGRVKQVKPLKMKAGVDLEQLSERLQERDFGSTTIKHENGRFVRIIEEESFVYDSKNGNRISK